MAPSHYNDAQSMRVANAIVAILRTDINLRDQAIRDATPEVAYLANMVNKYKINWNTRISQNTVFAQLKADYPAHGADMADLLHITKSILPKVHSVFEYTEDDSPNFSLLSEPVIVSSQRKWAILPKLNPSDAAPGHAKADVSSEGRLNILVKKISSGRTESATGQVLHASHLFHYCLKLKRTPPSLMEVQDCVVKCTILCTSYTLGKDNF